MMTHVQDIVITFSKELSGGRLAGMGGWALIGVDISVVDESSTT